MTRDDHREQTPPSLLASAPVVWAMLSAVGWDIHGAASSVEEEIRDRYASLAESPEADYSSCGRVTLRRLWDGDDFVGLGLTLDVSVAWADQIHADFPTVEAVS